METSHLPGRTWTTHPAAPAAFWEQRRCLNFPPRRDFLAHKRKTPLGLLFELGKKTRRLL